MQEDPTENRLSELGSLYIIIIIIIIIIVKQCNSTVSRERGLWLDVFLPRV